MTSNRGERQSGACRVAVQRQHRLGPGDSPSLPTGVSSVKDARAV
jgi:hypothetical protein